MLTSEVGEFGIEINSMDGLITSSSTQGSPMIISLEKLITMNLVKLSFKKQYFYFKYQTSNCCAYVSVE